MNKRKFEEESGNCETKEECGEQSVQNAEKKAKLEEEIEGNYYRELEGEIEGNYYRDLEDCKIIKLPTSGVSNIDIIPMKDTTGIEVNQMVYGTNVPFDSFVLEVGKNAFIKISRVPNEKEKINEETELSFFFPVLLFRQPTPHANGNVYLHSYQKTTSGKDQQPPHLFIKDVVLNFNPKIAQPPKEQKFFNMTLQFILPESYRELFKLVLDHAWLSHIIAQKEKIFASEYLKKKNWIENSIRSIIQTGKFNEKTSKNFPDFFQVSVPLEDSTNKESELKTRDMFVDGYTGEVIHYSKVPYMCRTDLLIQFSENGLAIQKGKEFRPKFESLKINVYGSEARQRIDPGANRIPLRKINVSTQ